MSYAFTERPSRGGFARVLVWSEVNGMILDVAGRHCGAVEPGEPSERLFEAADARAYPEQRERSLSVHFLRADHAAFYRRMRAQGCPVQACLLSPGGGHVLWLEPSTPAGLDEPAAFGAFSPGRVRLFADAFEQAVCDGPDLLASFPWYGESASSDLTLAGPPGYVGPVWTVTDAGDGIDDDGAAALASTATVTFNFPAATAQLRLHVTGGSGTLYALGAGDAVLDSESVGEVLTLPTGTRRVRVTVSGAVSERPGLEVVSAGRAQGITDGVCVDCDDGLADWGAAAAAYVYAVAPASTSGWAVWRLEIVAGTWEEIRVLASEATQIRVDADAGWVFVIEGGSGGFLQRCRLDGSDYDSGLASNFGYSVLALDRSAQEVLVPAASFANDIRVLDHDGTAAGTLPTGVWSRAIAYDPIGEWAYYINEQWKGSGQQRLWRIRKNGTDDEEVYGASSLGAITANAAFDGTEGVYFFRDQFTLYKVEVDEEGAGTLSTITASGSGIGLDIDPAARKLYHTSGGFVQRRDYDGANGETLGPQLSGIRGIAVSTR